MENPNPANPAPVLNFAPVRATMVVERAGGTVANGDMAALSRKYVKLLLRLAMLKSVAVLVMLDEKGEPCQLIVLPKVEMLR